MQTMQGGWESWLVLWARSIFVTKSRSSVSQIWRMFFTKSDFVFLPLSNWMKLLLLTLNREASVAGGIAAVYKSAASWVPMDTGKGSRVDLYFNSATGAYRIISLDNATKQVHYFWFAFLIFILIEIVWSQLNPYSTNYLFSGPYWRHFSSMDGYCHQNRYLNKVIKNVQKSLLLLLHHFLSFFDVFWNNNWEIIF